MTNDAARSDRGAHRFDASVLLLVVILLAAAALRVPGIFSDFWLDEIWTLGIVEGLDSPVEVFTDVPNSNNHHLITLSTYLLGPERAWPVYRIPSLLFGLASVVLAWGIARRTGRAEANLAAILVASSYLMVQFSTEARGYAAVVFFALLAFLAAERFVTTKRVTWAIVLAFTTILGFTSHLMYLHAFAGIGLWLLVRLWRESDRPGDAIRRLAVVYGIPVLFTALFYFTIYRRMIVSGSPPREALDVLVKATSLAAGGPMTGPLAATCGIALVVAFLAAVAWFAWKQRGEWLVYATVIFVSPAVALALSRPDTLYVRYFLLGFCFGYLALAHLFAAMWRSGHAGRIAVALLVVAFLAGNAINTTRFLRFGHGGTSQAIALMAEQTTGPVIHVTSDEDFRASVLLDYYQRLLPSDKRLAYHRQDAPADRPVDWLLRHRFGDLGEVAPFTTDARGRTFELVESYRYCGLSGWNWMLYRLRVPR